MLSYLLAALAAAQVVSRSRWVLPGASGRLRRLGDTRLRLAHDAVTQTAQAWSGAALLSWSLGGAVVSAYVASPRALLVTGSSAVGFAAALWLRSRGRAAVVTAFDDRGLQPLTRPGETSELRRQRQRLYGVMAIVLLPAGQTLVGVQLAGGPGWAGGLGAALVLVGITAAGVVGVAGAWRHGDERPAEQSAQQ